MKCVFSLHIDLPDGNDEKTVRERGGNLAGALRMVADQIERTNQMASEEGKTPVWEVYKDEYRA